MEKEFHEIAAFKNGDEKVFKSIYNTFYGPIFYFIKRIVDNCGEAEDITAETFVKLWNLRANFETIQNIKAFLYITARNASLTALKQRKDNSRRTEELEYYFQHLQNMDGPSIQDEVKAQVLKKLHEEIETLPLQCRKIFKLFFMDGLRNAEIAQKLGLTLQTVKNQKTRAVKLLKLSMTSREWQLILLLQVYIDGVLN